MQNPMSPGLARYDPIRVMKCQWVTSPMKGDNLKTVYSHHDVYHCILQLPPALLLAKQAKIGSQIWYHFYDWIIRLIVGSKGPFYKRKKTMTWGSLKRKSIYNTCIYEKKDIGNRLIGFRICVLSYTFEELFYYFRFRIWCSTTTTSTASLTMPSRNSVS